MLLTDAAAPPVRAVGAALPQVAAGRGKVRVDLSTISTLESMYFIIVISGMLVSGLIRHSHLLAGPGGNGGRGAGRGRPPDHPDLVPGVELDGPGQRVLLHAVEDILLDHFQLVAPLRPSIKVIINKPVT